jgi:NAD(P) transhydrogenase subunit alpha
MTEALIVGIVVFTLATFLGVELIHRVPPTLHTPLMSGSNAISGITVVGALTVAGGDHGWISVVIGFLAIVFAVINVVGGYAVTDRMLGMFTRERPSDGG